MLPGKNEMQLNRAAMCEAVQQYLNGMANCIIGTVYDVAEDKTSNTFTVKLEEPEQEGD